MPNLPLDVYLVSTVTSVDRCVGGLPAPDRLSGDLGRSSAVYTVYTVGADCSPGSAGVRAVDFLNDYSSDCVVKTRTFFEP